MAISRLFSKFCFLTCFCRGFIFLFNFSRYVLFISGLFCDRRVKKGCKCGPTFPLLCWRHDSCVVLPHIPAGDLFGFSVRVANGPLQNSAGVEIGQTVLSRIAHVISSRVEVPWRPEFLRGLSRKYKLLVVTIIKKKKIRKVDALCSGRKGNKNHLPLVVLPTNRSAPTRFNRQWSSSTFSGRRSFNLYQPLSNNLSFDNPQVSSQLSVAN